MGPYLSQPITTKHVITGKSDSFSFCTAEMQGWRKTMQDAAINEPNLGDGNALFGVFDGHGGHQVSKYVQKKFKQILTTLDLYKNKQYNKALDVAFKKMDQMLSSSQATNELNGSRNVHISDPITKGTGCTANVLLITPTHFIVANAGDSRSVLCKNGQAIDLSFDHKPEDEIEVKRIKNAGGVVYMGRVNGGLNLTRSFGDFDYKSNQKLGYDQQMITCKPDIKEFSRNKNEDEFILMGCDGIWQRYVNNSQGLIDIVKNYIVDKLEDTIIMQKLLNQLLARDCAQGIGCDNMTSIIIRFK